MKKKITASLVGMSLLLPIAGCGASNEVNSLQIADGVEFGEKDYEKIVTPSNELGFELLDKIKPDDEGNLFISPTSLWMAIALAYNGADGATKEEIAKVLQVSGMDSMDVNKANASLMTALDKDSESIRLQIANSIWLNEEYQFQKEYAQRTKNYFNAEIAEIDIKGPDSPKMINEWVRKATNDKIEKMVDGPLDENFVAMLLNAIYFKGDWKFPFDKKVTENREFRLMNGTEKEVPFMKLQEELPYMANNEFQAVKLPYENGEMSMTIVLPNEQKSFDEFQAMLSAEKWEALQSDFKSMRGTLLLPKFKMEYETELNDALKSLGMASAFTDFADFSKMVEGDASLLISKVKQKTYIDVNEEGTEAAAVTSVQMEATSAPVDTPFEMEANRPFFLMITDDETGIVLFIGFVANPEI